MRTKIYILSLFLVFTSVADAEVSANEAIIPKDPHAIRDKTTARGDKERAAELMAVFGYGDGLKKKPERARSGTTE